MTEGATYWSLRGREYKLGPPVDGEGSGVYDVPLSREVVARIHPDGSDLAVCERKVQAMLKRPPLAPWVVEDGERFVRMAWPVASLHDTRGSYIGYLMPAVDIQATSPLEYVLQERQARAAGLPTSLGAKITLAARLSVAINELHELGHRVVYLTPANLRFYKQSLYLALIDCERLSLRADNERFAADPDAADRNAAHYLAPEFQEEPIPRDSEELQDRFALPVLIFQLLNFGIHPFTGTPTNDQVPADIPGRIAGNYYAYGLVPNENLEPSPGSGHEAMPRELRALFDRAFTGKPSARPQAHEWATWLQFYAIPSNNCVVVCSVNSRHHHFAGLPCAACLRAPLLPAYADEVELPLEDEPVAAVKEIVPPFVPVERAFPPANRAPPARRPPPPEPRWQLPSFMTVIKGIGTALVAFLVLSYLGVFEPSPNAHRASTSVPAHPASSPAAPPPPALDPMLAGTPALQQDEALTDGYVTAATTAIATDDRPEWQRAIINLHTDIPPHPTVPPGDVQAAFASFAAGLSPGTFNEGKRQELLGKLKQQLKHNPFDEESAYELGWLDMVGGQREEAKIYFLHALWLNPDRAEAWYALAVIAGGDRQMLGALATAELLPKDPAQAEAMRNAFPPLLLRLCSVDPDVFAKLQARARQRADQYRPLVPASVFSLPANDADASTK